MPDPAANRALEATEVSMHNEPGVHEGRHFTEWVDTVSKLKRDGQFDAALELLEHPNGGNRGRGHGKQLGCCALVLRAGCHRSQQTWRLRSRDRRLGALRATAKGSQSQAGEARREIEQTPWLNGVAFAASGRRLLAARSDTVCRWSHASPPRSSAACSSTRHHRGGPPSHDPGQLLLPWNDDEIDRESGLALFDVFGSQDKTVHAFPGSHFTVPVERIDTRFFARHLAGRGGLAA